MRRLRRRMRLTITRKNLIFIRMVRRMRKIRIRLRLRIGG